MLLVGRLSREHGGIFRRENLEAFVEPLARSCGSICVGRRELVPMNDGHLQQFFIKQLLELRRGTAFGDEFGWAVFLEFAEIGVRQVWSPDKRDNRARASAFFHDPNTLPGIQPSVCTV